MLVYNENNIIHKLGRNAKENFDLIDDADPNDWWFHLEDYPSGHCIVNKESELLDLDNKIKEVAGNLIKKYSKYKNNKNLKIVFTQIKNLVKTKTVGQVKLLKVDGFFFI